MDLSDCRISTNGPTSNLFGTKDQELVPESTLLLFARWGPAKPHSNGCKWRAFRRNGNSLRYEYIPSNEFVSLGSIRLTLPGINMEVENRLVVEDFMVFQGAIFHFHVSSRECISREAY